MRRPVSDRSGNRNGSTINERPGANTWVRAVLSQMVQQPFDVTETVGSLRRHCQVQRRRTLRQAGAIRHASPKPFWKWIRKNRPRLRRTGLLTRDPRVKERKNTVARSTSRLPFSKR